MSERWPGGLINQTAPVPTGPYATGTAPGVWTMDQQAYWVKQGLWPTAGLFPNYIEDVFSTYLYTGNNTTNVINNGIDLAGKGGMVWCKCRTAARSNIVFDTARGIDSSSGLGYSLYTNATNAQSTLGLTAFNSNGFSINDFSVVNASPDTYASWTFRKQPKFFDVVTYTGNGVAGRAISHSLGSTPGMILVKCTTAAQNWWVWHRSKNDGDGYLVLNSTSPGWNGAAPVFGDDVSYIAPTATNFTISSYDQINGSGQTYVAYLFAHNAGGFGTSGTDNVISCGSFTADGSGNVDVNLGYEPQFLMYKDVTSAEDWFISDVMRGFNNTNVSVLRPNTSGTESSYSANPSYLLPTATGFKTGTGGLISASQTYIYMAIRRPMKTPTTGTSVFSPNTSADSLGTKITTNFPIDSQLICYRAGSIGTNSNFNDRLRGNSSTTTSSGNLLVTSNTNAEVASSVTRNWDNTGFEISDYYQASSTIYWNFARRPGFFDTVCYTGTGAGTAFNHNLGVTPEMMIIKSRSGAYDWVVYSNALNGGVTPASYYLKLNTTDAQINFNGIFNGTDPTSTQFTVGSDNRTNRSTSTYVAYLFATCPGVSKVGSYTGNGSSQTINCGFTGGARFVLIKRTDSTGDWYVYDTARGMTTLVDPYLLLNSTAAESATLGSVTTTTGGFTVNASILSAINTSGGSYIFLAIA